MKDAGQNFTGHQKSGVYIPAAKANKTRVKENVED